MTGSNRRLDLRPVVVECRTNRFLLPPRTAQNMGCVAVQGRVQFQQALSRPTEFFPCS